MTIEAVVGEWELVSDVHGRSQGARLQVVHLEGRKLDVFVSGAKFSGEIENEKMCLEFNTRDGEQLWRMSGQLVGEGINLTGLFQGVHPATWRLTRPRTPGRPPETCVFKPTSYCDTISAKLPPVKTIVPGDIIVTQTLDSNGIDETGVSRTPYPGLVGPFYVEGAMPGDTLAVTLRSLRFNRNWATGKDSISRYAIPANYETLWNPNPGHAKWILDTSTGKATLDNAPRRLKEYWVPLKASIGSIAVAPRSDEELRSKRNGRYGGDLDCTLLTQGTTVFLPVAHPGALLFIGDGHATYGEGEVAGDALETSLDIQFTVAVKQDQRIEFPRADDGENLIAIGLGDTMTDALRQATGELGLWLKDSYGMSPKEIALLFSTALRYSISKFHRQPCVAGMVPKRVCEVPRD